MRLKQFDNRDPRWTEADLAAIDAKVAEAIALLPPLELASEGGVMTPEERRWLLTSSFREIVKATSLDNLVAAPPAMLEQFAVLALKRNHNAKGELVQLIRVFMMAYADPGTNREASAWLDELEKIAKRAVASQKDPGRFQWRALPYSPSSRYGVSMSTGQAAEG